jgi:hypothetical protein
MRGADLHKSVSAPAAARNLPKTWGRATVTNRRISRDDN